jgi:hypothetical protein
MTTIQIPDSSYSYTTSSYEVVHSFSPTRCLIKYDSLYVFADCDDRGVWDLSGVPASPEETEIMKTFTAATDDTTVTTVTKNQ